MNPNAHWRDSARSPRFFFMSAYSVFPLLFFLMHINLTTFIVALISSLFFAILERFHFTIPVFFRWLRAFIAGPIKYSKHWYHPL